MWYNFYFAKMFQALHQYLLENHTLFIQGIGLFQLKQNPAKYEFGSQQILPPSHQIVITAMDASRSLQPLMGFISRQHDTDEESAFEAYTQFCDQLQQGITQEGFVYWPKLGKVIKRSTDNFEFQLDETLNTYLSPVTAKRVIVQDSSHAITVGENETTTNQMQDWLNDKAQVKSPKDYWWIWALLLGAAAITSIVLRLTQVL